VGRTLRGIEFGEELGFRGVRRLLVVRNPQWSRRARKAVRVDLVARLEARTVVGPFVIPPSDGFHSSRIHVVPKDGTGSRIVHDLSFPPGRSVNDGIDPADFVCAFESVDEAIALLQEVGVGALMLKRDWQSAYKQICVAPADWELCGFVVDGGFYMDTRLPFGARSSPAIFCRYSGQFQWVLRNQFGVRWTCHYADDHLLVAQESGGQSATSVAHRFDAAASELGVTIKPEKRLGPATTMMYLGIELDSVAMQARLSDERLQRTLVAVRRMAVRERASVREVQSLLGVLNFVCRVVPAGRSFLSRMIAALRSAVARRLPMVVLESAFKLDLRWWMRFLAVFNGVSLFLEVGWTDAEVFRVQCDASGSVGGGAVFGREWIFVRWTDVERGWNIAVLELVILVVACATWGRDWARRRIMFQSDNTAVCAAVTGRRVRHLRLMSWVRELHFVEARYGFSVRVVHIPGKENTLADLISRGRIDRFRTQFCARYGMLPAVAPVRHVMPVPV
jgi:hypothetical protein